MGQAKSHTRQDGWIERLEPRRLLAGVVLSDLNTDTMDGAPSSLSPHSVFEIDGVIYYYAYSAGDGEIAGHSLMRTDGTPQGSFRLLDLDHDSASSSGLSQIVNLNGQAYFLTDRQEGLELWKSDGTVAGTTLVKDLNPGAAAGFATAATQLYVWNSRLYFQATDGTQSGLWSTDGTAAGFTFLEMHTSASNPTNYVEASGVLYYVGRNIGAGGGWELFRSDGTAGGTFLVKDLYALGFNGISNFTLASYNGEVYFAGNANAGTGYELFKSDGTAAGTVLVKDLRSGTNDSTPSQFGVVNGKLCFTAQVNGRDLWVTDGTTAGTVLLQDLGTSSSFAGAIAVAGGYGYVNAQDELWRTDGTTAVQLGWARGAVVAANGLAYFASNHFTSATHIWRTDGTVAGTFDITPNSYTTGTPDAPLAAGNFAYAYVYKPAYGRELHRLDPSGAEAHVMLDDASRMTQLSSNNPFYTAASGGVTYLGATSTSGAGVELFKLDANNVKVLVKDINPGAGSSRPRRFTDGNGVIYFVANDGSHGEELWRSDGTSGGTSMVTDLTVGGGSSAISEIAFWNGKIYFAKSGDLYVSDGTDAGTTLVDSGGAVSNLFAGNYLYFAKQDATSGRELWRTDGLPGGTALVADVVAGTGWSSPTPVGAVGGGIYFTAFTASQGTQLFYTSGSGAQMRGPAYTTGFGDFTSATGTFSLYYTRPDPIQPYKLIFTAYDFGTGTVGNTRLMSSPLAAVGFNVFWFDTDANSSKIDLWSTSGLVKTVETAPAGQTVSTSFLQMGVHNGVLYFTVWNSGTLNLWRSDGTAAGTYILEPLNALPYYIGSINGSLCVWMNDNYVSIEPVRITSALAATAGADSIVIRDSVGGLLYDVYVNAAAGSEPTWQLSRGTIAAPTLDTGTGVDIVSVIGRATFAETVSFAANSVTIGAQTIPTSGVESYYFDGAGGGDALTVSGGVVELPTWQTLGSLSVTGGTLKMRNVSIAYSGTSPLGAWNGTAYTGILEMLQAGRIVSSDGLGVGVIDTGSGVLLRSVRLGDANLDNLINGDDFFAIDAGFGAASNGYANGDFDYNGVIDADDYFLIDSSYSASLSPLPAAVARVGLTLAPANEMPLFKRRLINELE